MEDRKRDLEQKRVRPISANDADKCMGVIGVHSRAETGNGVILVRSFWSPNPDAPDFGPDSPDMWPGRGPDGLDIWLGRPYTLARKGPRGPDSGLDGLGGPVFGLQVVAALRRGWSGWPSFLAPVFFAWTVQTWPTWKAVHFGAESPELGGPASGPVFWSGQLFGADGPTSTGRTDGPLGLLRGGPRGNAQKFDCW